MTNHIIKRRIELTEDFLVEIQKRIDLMQDGDTKITVVKLVEVIHLLLEDLKTMEKQSIKPKAN